MIWIAYILLALIFAFFTVQVFALVMINETEKPIQTSNDQKPFVSILLAARNEEKLILRSLTALEAISYDPNRLEILIGNDQSTDHTEELIKSFINNKPIFRLFNIDQNLGKARGKANVLAHLAREAQGEIFFITDVDVQIPKQWIETMVSAFTTQVGIVSGTTKCERGSFFATMQAIDWLHFMGYIKSFANAGIACTAVGNNMAVRANAYFETGGFETLDFSITEDYRLFQQITKNGWEWRTLLNKKSLGKAWFIESWRDLLDQRKRWLIGAKDLSVLWKFLLGLYASFTPALFILFFINPNWALLVWGIKFFFQVVYISALVKKVETRPFSLLRHLEYELYVLINTLASVIYYILPIKSKWKGRLISSTDLS